VGHITLEVTDDGAKNRITVCPGANFTLTVDDLAWLKDQIGQYDLVMMQFELPMEVIEQDGEAVLRGRVMAHLLCINALEEIDCYDKVCEYTLPRRYPRPAADVIAQCYPSVGSVSARKVGDDTSAAIVLTVRGIVSFRSTQTVLADVQCTSPLVRDDGDIALRIYFAQAGEDMFDIAKRYAASPEAIAAANDTGSGILEAPQRLLIPSAT